MKSMGYVIDLRLAVLSETKGDNGTRASRFVEIQAEPQNRKHRKTPKSSLSHAFGHHHPAFLRVSVTKHNVAGCELASLFRSTLELLGIPPSNSFDRPTTLDVQGIVSQ